MKPTFKFSGNAAPGDRRRRRCTGEERSRYLALFAASGLSVPAFCRVQGISAATFYNWRRQAGERRRPELGANGFAQVQVATGAAVPAEGALCVHVGNLVVEARAGTDAAWIGRVVAELRGTG